MPRKDELTPALLSVDAKEIRTPKSEKAQEKSGKEQSDEAEKDAGTEAV